MSTKFYIKDENGIFLSIDGKTKYTCLEGQALYDFLKTEDGRGRCFHVDIDEDGNKIGIEASPEFLKAEESDKNHAAYLERQKAESGVEIISANIIVRDSETEVELIETVADITVNVELEALKAIDLQNLRKALLPSIFFLCGSAKLLRNADRLLYQACEEEKERVEHG